MFRRACLVSEFLMATVLVLGGCSQLEQDSPTSVEFSLENLAWLEGLWAGPGFEGTVEEYWSAPAGRSIAGMFRLVVAGQTRVVELRTLLEEANGLILRLNHFTPALQRWKREPEPLNYRLVELTRARAVFESETPRESLPERIIYLRAEGQLTVERQSRGATTTKLHLQQVK